MSRKPIYSRFKCYCGFENVIQFYKPNRNHKAWLESDCLRCNARYDIRIYPHDKDQEKVNIHKRIITSSPEVDHAIAKESAIKKDNNGVLNGEANKRIKESQSH